MNTLSTFVCCQQAGLIMADVDYVSAHKALIASQVSSPFELNLGWAVSLDKAS